MWIHTQTHKGTCIIITPFFFFLLLSRCLRLFVPVLFFKTRQHSRVCKCLCAMFETNYICLVCQARTLFLAFGSVASSTVAASPRCIVRNPAKQLSSVSTENAELLCFRECDCALSFFVLRALFHANVFQVFYALL
uniref:Putative secreted protein n=1 Tax=Amblyomma cajennense TaxID=34607 RepID=A0A023FCL5_AMBCJ